MQIEIKENESCKLSVKYIADAEEISEKKIEVLKHFNKAPVPGNRKGKASLNAIKIHYRTQIEESLKRALAEDAYHNTIFEKKLRPHGAPAFNSAVMTDKGFECEFNLNVKPDFNLNTYKEFEIPKPHQDLTVAELTEKMMQELRVRFGSTEPYDEDSFVQNGDSVMVDYEGFVDGEKINNLCAKGEMLTIGTSQLVSFDESLLGMTMGETREFDVVVPESGLPSLVGKNIHFVVTLNMGSKNVPCPLNDELSAKLGKANFGELRDFVFQTATARMEQSNHGVLTGKVASILIDNHKFDVPNWLTLSEAKYLVYQSKLEWENLIDIDKEKYMTMAENNVKLSLVLDRIRDEEPEAQLSDQEVFEMIKQNLANSKSQATPDEIIREMNKTGYLQILFSKIRDEYTLDFVTKTLKIIE